MAINVSTSLKGKLVLRLATMVTRSTPMPVRAAARLLAAAIVFVSEALKLVMMGTN
jgi:hypothetical protein